MNSREKGGGPSPAERGELIVAPETGGDVVEQSMYEMAQETLNRLWRLRDQANEMLKDPVLREGADATMILFANTAIAIADVFPVVGEIASWSADAAKIWANRKYKRERQEAIEAGEDPDEVKKVLLILHQTSR